MNVVRRAAPPHLHALSYLRRKRKEGTPSGVRDTGRGKTLPGDVCPTLIAFRVPSGAGREVRSENESCSVWPKQFTAVITAVIFGRITAESVSAILSCVSVVRDKESYPLLVQFWFNSPYLKPWKYQHVQVRSQNMAETSNFRPKMAVSAENHIFGRNFGYGRISASFKLFLTVTVFRQKFSFGHTLMGI